MANDEKRPEGNSDDRKAGLLQFLNDLAVEVGEGRIVGLAIAGLRPDGRPMGATEFEQAVVAGMLGAVRILETTILGTLFGNADVETYSPPRPEKH